MKWKTLPTLVLICALSSLANAHECVASQPPLIDLLNQHSESYGTKFIVDPRVRAKVNLVGIETKSINTALLIGSHTGFLRFVWKQPFDTLAGAHQQATGEYTEQTVIQRCRENRGKAAGYREAVGKLLDVV